MPWRPRRGWRDPSRTGGHGRLASCAARRIYPARLRERTHWSNGSGGARRFDRGRDRIAAKGGTCGRGGRAQAPGRALAGSDFAAFGPRRGSNRLPRRRGSRGRSRTFSRLRRISSWAPHMARSSSNRTLEGRSSHNRRGAAQCRKINTYQCIG